jgi:glycosyltransferase involved in cell wall biosynthesis
VKLWFGRHCDAYFAYTDQVKARLVELGYDERRVTSVQNTVERPAPTAVSEEAQALESELGLSGREKVVLFCGRMYPEKQLGLLIEAVRLAHSRSPDLTLFLAGAGPDERLAREAASEHHFIHYLGPVSGRRKAAAFEMPRFMAMSGLVGLAIVDAFHAGLPLVTVRYPHHSPEIAYLRPGENGLLVAPEPEALADALVRLTKDDELLSRLRSGAAEAGRGLGMDEMVRRFSDGILRALGRTAAHDTSMGPPAR